jgi:hypothetical protein
LRGRAFLEVIAIDFVRDLTAGQREMLLQLYTIERQDNQNSQTVDFAIIAAALTYVIASSAFLLGHCNSTTCGTIPPVVQLASPVILIALLSFLTLSVAATIMRAKHLRYIEELLGLEAEAGVILPSFQRDSSDIYEVKIDRLLKNFHRMRRAKLHQANLSRILSHRDFLQLIYVPLTLVAYVSTLLIALGYTIGVMLPGPWTWDKTAAMTTYILILLLQAAGILAPLMHPRFRTSFEVD